ncbi:MAG TPA: tetratricopeptide repeat protein [Bryobacteraceae bacterium]|nr:tetratricopeptide repeat protein [Bryobacteraceae bacterium]
MQSQVKPAPVYRSFPAIVALITFLVFLPALQNDWVNWDDTGNFLENSGYRGLGWTQIKWMWTTDLLRHYIPLSWMTLGLDYTIWGMNPLGYHLTNVMLHTANAVAFYFLAIAIFKIALGADAQSTIPLGAFCAALAFSLHPLRVESVAWITERRDVLCGLFYLIAILYYIHAYAPGSPHRRKYYWLSLASFALALLSKEIAVTLPALLLLLDVYPLRRQLRQIWWNKIPFFALAAVLLFRMFFVSNEILINAHDGAGAFVKSSACISNLAFYLWKTIVPASLSPVYASTSPLAIGAIVVLAITAAAVLLRPRFPALLAVWISYIVLLSPVLGFVATGPRLPNDRNTYLACLGWALVAGAASALWWNRATAVRWLMPVTLLFLIVFTEKQIRIWRDSDSLWTHALNVAPSFTAYNNMAEALVSRGDDLWAAEDFRKSIALNPNYSPAHVGLGGALLRLRRIDDAAREFQAALALGRDVAFAHNGLACALALQGKPDEAISHFQQAIRLRPDYVDARRNLAQVLAKKPN